MSEFADFMDGITDALDEEIQDAVLLDDGEYELRIVSMNFRASDDEEKPSPRYNFGLEPVSNPDAEMIWHSVWLPHSTKDARANKRSNRELKAFCIAFGLGWPVALPFEEDTMKGLTVFAQVGSETYEGEQKNKINSWVREA